MTDYDSPWKEILDDYFAEFMAFFFPTIHQDIDWSRGYESLDTELQQIVRDAELGRRLADKLMKVWRHGGAEQVVMIHVDVQGDRKPDFPQRMYIYHYRFFDRWMIRLIMWMTKGPTDPTAVIEFTDWAQVEAFGRRIAALGTPPESHY